MNSGNNYYVMQSHIMGLIIMLIAAQNRGRDVKLYNVTWKCQSFIQHVSSCLLGARINVMLRNVLILNLVWVSESSQSSKGREV